MIFKEVAAFLMLTILPGLAVAGILRASFGRFRSFLLLPGLSLPVNYLFASVMSAVGLFTPLASWIYTFCCLFLVIFIYRKPIAGSLKCHPLDAIEKHFQAAGAYLAGGNTPQWLRMTAFAGALAGIFYCISWFWNGVDNIFTCWDSALSWNYWAESWAKGVFPARVGEYPQLLPMNWAIAYHLTGENIQFVPKAAISIFPLLTVLFFWERGIFRRQDSLLFAIPVWCFYFSNVGYLSHGGELDLLISYYPVAVYFIFLYAGEAESKSIFFRQLITAAIITAAAGVTKQAGLYLLFAFWVLAHWMLKESRERLQISRRQWFGTLLAVTGGCILFVAPWYLVAIARTGEGRNQSNIQLVTHSIYGGKSLFDRFLCSIRLFVLKLQSGLPGIASARWAVLDKSSGIVIGIGKLYGLHLLWGVVVIIFDLAVIGICRRVRGYLPLLGVTLLFFLIWSIFFCYDLRNLSLVLPFIALLVAVSSTELLEKYAAKFKLLPLLSAVMLIFVLTNPAQLFTRNRVMKFHSRQLDAGDPVLNRQLLEVIREKGIKKQIISDYEYMKIIPGLQPYYCHLDLSVRNQVILDNFRRMMADDTVSGILLPDYAMPEIIAEVRNAAGKNAVTRVFTIGEMSLWLKKTH